MQILWDLYLEWEKSFEMIIVHTKNNTQNLYCSLWYYLCFLLSFLFIISSFFIFIFHANTQQHFHSLIIFRRSIPDCFNLIENWLLNILNQSLSLLFWYLMNDFLNIESIQNSVKFFQPRQVNYFALSTILFFIFLRLNKIIQAIRKNIFKKLFFLMIILSK